MVRGIGTGGISVDALGQHSAAVNIHDLCFDAFYFQIHLHLFSLTSKGAEKIAA